MKKLKLRYGGGQDSILLDLKEKKFYSFEKDFSELQQSFGAEMTYCSSTGLTGAGLVPQGDFILFGTYRVDVTHPEQIGKIVQYKNVTDYYTSEPIYGYVPIMSHGGIQHNYPFVLSDGKSVAFLRSWDVTNMLMMWKEKELDFERKVIVTYRPGSGETKENYVWKFYNPNHMEGVDAKIFLDFREEREIISTLTSHQSMFERNLRIFNYSDGAQQSLWYGFNEYYIDAEWEEDPRKINGPIHNDWSGDGSGLYWKRLGFQVCAFFECRREEIREGAYVYENSYEFVDYEENIPLLDWYQKPVEEWSKYFLRKVTYKASKDALAQLSSTRQVEDLVEKLNNVPNVVLTIKDSYDAGNCGPGTENFIRQFNLESEMKISEILNHPHFKEMVQNRDFRKVLILKLDTLEN